MSFTNHDSTRLNQSAAHDTGIYDPDIHDNQIVAMYDTDAQARSARDMLVSKGIAADSIQVVAKGSETGTLGGVNAEDSDNSLWTAIKNIFAPDDDRSAFSHAVGRGHAMLIVHPTETTDRTMLVHTLEATNPVDFDARLEEWRQAGYDTSTPHAEYTDTMGARDVRSPRFSEGGTTRADTSSAGGEHDRSGTPRESGERSRVGKRAVEAGAARVRSYVAERPMGEQAGTRMGAETRAMDARVMPGDMAATEARAIEARATSEEPVVSTTAGVAEEAGRTTEGGVQNRTPKTPAATEGATTSGANAPRR